MGVDKKQKHIVLIHGAGHGAWCWYKVATQLRSQNLRVTALDMAAAGVNTQPLSELITYSYYSRPLMKFLAALPPKDSVVLVGHSMGGVSISLAMEKFPRKIDVAVFVIASMPGPSLSSQEIHDQDLTLATVLVRPTGFLENTIGFSNENYGSVRRVYMITEKDEISKKEFQEWIIQNNPPDEVKMIHGSDHMFMLSKPLEFCVCLQEIVDKYCNV